MSVEVTVSPIPDDLGNVTHAMIRLRELAGASTVDVLPAAACHDPLTGVLTREALAWRLQS